MIGTLKFKCTARTIAIALLMTMMVWLLPANMLQVSAVTYPKAPRAAINGTVTWNCVWFGHYSQSSNGKGGFNNDPIKWRVLSVNGKDALLMADKNLDVKVYNETETRITWDKSAVRSWLNGYGSNFNQDGISYTSDNFINKAFTAGERSAIYEKRVVNDNHPDYGTAGGENTKDKVFLLSIAEAKKPAYGFSDNKAKTVVREVNNTDYAINRGVWTSSSSSTGKGVWWLRSPGGNPGYAANVHEYGLIHLYGNPVDNSYIGIRPVLHLNLSSKFWKHAGKISVFAPTAPEKSTIKSVKASKASLYVTWKRDTKALGYQVTVAQDSQFTKGKKSVTITGNKITSKTLTKLAEKKTYYVKVRAYVTGGGKTKLYGLYSEVKTVKVE